MSRFLLASFATVALISMSGCLGAGRLDSCNGCEWGALRPHPAGPLEALRDMRRSLVCSEGCGEVYYGEWRSTPPDCEDPCPQFGGACHSRQPTPIDCGGCGTCASCQPPIRPVRLIGGLVRGLYGKRYCDHCGDAVTDCGCDDCGGNEGVTLDSYEFANSGQAGTGRYATVAEKSLQKRQRARVSQSKPKTNAGPQVARGGVPARTQR